MTVAMVIMTVDKARLLREGRVTIIIDTDNPEALKDIEGAILLESFVFDILVARPEEHDDIAQDLQTAIEGEVGVPCRVTIIVEKATEEVNLKPRIEVKED